MRRLDMFLRIKATKRRPVAFYFLPTTSLSCEHRRYSSNWEHSTGMLIDGVHITPVKSVRDLGIYIDADLSMRMHVKKTASCCFAALRQLRQIRRYVPTSTFQKLVVALVHSRLDYGNGVLVGIPAHLMRRLQSVLNAAARLIFNLKRSDHITCTRQPSLAAGPGAHTV